MTALPCIVNGTWLVKHRDLCSKASWNGIERCQTEFVKEFRVNEVKNAGWVWIILFNSIALNL